MNDSADPRNAILQLVGLFTFARSRSLTALGRAAGLLAVADLRLHIYKLEAELKLARGQKATMQEFNCREFGE